MAGVEWGPKNVSTESRIILEVSRFSGSQLQEIDTQITTYLQTNPESTRDQAVIQLAQNNIKLRPYRIQLGLDVLNQLAVAQGGANDVRSVIVRQDTGSTIRKASGEGQNRAGEGQHHFYYEIDWINEPEKKPETQTSPATEKPTTYPFKTAEQSRAERQDGQRAFRDEKRAEKERQAAMDKVRAEKNSLRDIIVDEGKEIADQALTGELMNGAKIIIELGEDDKAVILYKDLYTRNPDGTPRFATVDRDTGVYETGIHLKYEASIPPGVMRYLRVKARELEYAQNPQGSKPDEYKPEEIPGSTYEQVYTRALELGLLRIEHTAERVRFMFQAFSSGGYNTPNEYVAIDLDRNVAQRQRYFELERPLNPQFADFLRQKKAQLEQKPVSK